MKTGKIISVNRRARFDYEIVDTLEAGLVLTSTEIKSIRDHRVNLSGAYVFPHNGEMWLYNSHIAPYPPASYSNHEPDRIRKLLLKRDQIRRLTASLRRKGFAIIPMRLYISGHYAKVQLGIGKGRRKRDKRREIKERSISREMREAARRDVSQ